jgi:hypothetical protein
MPRCMFRQNARSRFPSQCFARRVVCVAQNIFARERIGGDQNFFPDVEKCSESRPIIADDRRPARGCF